jgi:hypothetical protein
MPKRLIGHRTALGAADTRNINPYLPGTGWVVTFDSAVMASNLTELEVYHIAVDGPIGSSLAVLIDGFQWDYVAQGWANGWDPSQPILLQQASALILAWNVAATAPPYDRISNIQPVATLWLRHEQAAAMPILPGLEGVIG